jgi:basic membrane lipoprotein Med (substrate-binding protein (PBP1-ABC) superfamily)
MVGFMNSLNKGTWIALPLVLVSLLVGCTRSGEGENNGTNSAATTTGSAPSASGKALKIGMVFDSGGRGDGSFNDSAYAGLEKAQKIARAKRITKRIWRVRLRLVLMLFSRLESLK